MVIVMVQAAFNICNQARKANGSPKARHLAA